MEINMKVLLFSILLFLGFSLTACSSKKMVSDDYYDRANKASSESQRGLDRD